MICLHERERRRVLGLAGRRGMCDLPRKPRNGTRTILACTFRDIVTSGGEHMRQVRAFVGGDIIFPRVKSDMVAINVLPQLIKQRFITQAD